MADPYGRDIVSPITRPGGAGFEFVPKPGFPPGGVPSYLRPIPFNTRDPRQVLENYLDANRPQVARFLYSTWNNEREQLTFQEIRNAIRDRQVPTDWLDQWRADYSKFVTGPLDNEWRQAIAAGGDYLTGGISNAFGRQIEFTPTTNAIEEWINARGGELAVSLTNDQHRAMQSLIRHYTLEEPVGVDELGRILRPVIGLTPKQARAVQAFRDDLVEKGELTLPKIDHQVENYSARLWRMRGQRIARTELSFAHNFGQHEALEQAQKSGELEGRVVKQWRTEFPACQFCTGLNNMRVDLKETFPGLTKKVPFVKTPPAHPNCNCGITYELLAAA